MNLGRVTLIHSIPSLEHALSAYHACQFEEALDLLSTYLSTDPAVEDQAIIFLLQAQVYLSISSFRGRLKSIQQAQKSMDRLESIQDPILHSKIQPIRLFLEAQIAQKEQAFDQAQRLYQDILSIVGPDDAVWNVLTLYGLSDLMLNQNRMTESFDWITQALQMIREQEIPTFLKIKVHNQVGQVLLKQNRYDEIPAYARPALDWSREIGDVEEELNAMKNLAICFAAKQDYPSAMDYFLECLRKSEQLHYRPVAAQCLINIGTIYANLLNYDDAIGKYTQVLKEYGDITTTQSQSGLYNNIGNIYYSKEKYRQSIKFFDKAKELAVANSYDQMLARTTMLQGRALVALKRYEEAEKMALQAKELIRELPVFKGRQINLMTLSLIHLHKKEYDSAEQLLQEAIEEARQQKEESNEMDAYQILSELFEQQGKKAEALLYIKKYIQTQQKYGLEQRNRQIISREIQHATLEKEREIELLQKENEFQRILLERNERIEIQNAQLMEANEELRQFAYVVSHDLKEPLRMIGSYSTIIQRAYKDLVDEDGELYFQYVKEGVERMDKLLRNLLKYTTVGKTNEEKEEVDLQEVVELAVINLRVKVEETQARIACGNLPKIKGSKSLLIQLFQNLISNAIKFQQPDVPPMIQIDWEAQESRGVVKVADNGIGIAEEYQERIFEIFQRLHPRTQYEGTGIGLAICQKIVKRLGGNIWLESAEGEGTTFYFSIPLDAIVGQSAMISQTED